VTEARFLPFDILFSERFLDHDPGPDHPESPARMTAILDRLGSGPLSRSYRLVEPEPCALSDILRVHDQNYLFRFEERVLKGRQFLDHPDNRLSWFIYQSALLAAGACTKAVDLAESRARQAAPPFCLVRPPGHHADPKHALGFCFLNNAAIAARYWQREHERRRILIFDFDAHHGNGIQDVFYEDPDVFYISLHEDPILSFPGTGFSDETGQGPGLGANLNIPFRQGGTEEEVLELLETRVEPAIEEFEPEAMIVAAGFDAHIMDDMSGLQFTTRTYGKIGTYVRAWAEGFCSGRVVSILEGGYNLDVLGPSVELYLGALSIELPAQAD